MDVWVVGVVFVMGDVRHHEVFAGDFCVVSHLHRDSEDGIQAMDLMQTATAIRSCGALLHAGMPCDCTFVP